MSKASPSPAPEEQAAAPTPKKSKLKLPLIGLLVVAVGGGGFFAYKTFFTSPAKPAAAEGHAAEGEEAAAEESSGHGGGHGGAEADHSKDPAILSYEPFLVNLADKDAFRYLRVTIRLQVANKATAEKIVGAEVLNTQIRDTILGTLTTKVADDIVTPQGKDQLKAEITEKLNAFLPGKPVKAVFFSDFVVQL